MSDLDHPEYSPSKTPRVDRAERLIYSDEKEPIKYVLATFAKHLEMELNQALADLKAARQAPVDLGPLHTKIGQQALEIDFLEHALTKAGLLSAGK